MVQRMIMASDALQSKKAYWLSALIAIPFFFIVALAGMAVNILNPEIDGNNVFLFLINEFMPSGFKGFAVAGLIAVIMSTADSFMNTAAISFSHDFLKTIKRDNLSNSQELQITKAITLLVGVIACITAMQFDSLIDMMLYSYLLWGAVISVPLIAGLFDIKASRYAFYLNMISGISTAIIWTVLDLSEIYYLHSILPALLANLLTFSGCMLVEKLRQEKF